MLWQHDDCLLPHYTSLLVVYVMYLVEYHPLYVTDHLRAPIQIITEDLRCHYHTACLLVHAHITRYYANCLCAEFQAQFTVLLVGESLNWRRVNYFTLVFNGQGHTILCHNCLACTGVRCHKYTFLLLQVQD